MVFLYNVLFWAACILLVPYYGVRMLLTGRYRKGLGQRFGFIKPEASTRMEGSPRIWIHAVSVGEVTAAAPIVASLREQLPESCLVLSTTTETGQEMARRVVSGIDASFYYPLDIPAAIRGIMASVRPDIVVLVETELWPNFIGYCRKAGVKLVMVNGRLSPRSYQRYARTRFFWRYLLRSIDAVGAISEIDAERFRFLGVPPARLHVLGNAKFDSLASKADCAMKDEARRNLNIPFDSLVLVAGSTHEGEESIILDVYRELLGTHGQCTLIIAPRHVERAQAVRALAVRSGFEDIITLQEIAAGRTRLRERIIIVDLIGALFHVYSAATLVFCGGSLVPKGGQNILEAAAWGKVTLYGPFMDDFLGESVLLESVGAGVVVRNGKELLEGIRSLLADRETLAQRGEAGRRVVVDSKGASGRYAALIRHCLETPSAQ